MKRIFTYMLVSAALMAGCQKVNRIVRPGDDAADDGERVAIEFSSNMLTVDTKASLTGLNASNDLYVYGLNRTKPGVGEIINAKAHMARPAGAAEGWSESSGSLEFADDKTFFYNATKDRYDFYAYYVADAAEIPEKLDNYQIGITIDGTQDILLAAADPEKDIQASGVDRSQVTGTENVYSAWAARRGVTPNLEFRHVLAKYEFEVVNMGTKPVVLQSIQITSKTQGTLTVIDDESLRLAQGLVIRPEDTDATMTLVSKNFTTAGALLDDNGTADSEDDIYIDGVRLKGRDNAQTVQMQGEIMTFAGQTNNLIIRLTQQGMSPGQYRQITMPIDQNTVAGSSYLISLVIYSLESVDLNVTLAPWNRGEDIMLDQEDQIEKPDSDYEDVIYDMEQEQ